MHAHRTDGAHCLLQLGETLEAAPLRQLALPQGLGQAELCVVIAATLTPALGQL